MIDDTLLEAEEKMDKAVTVAKEDFNGIRTGRAHPAMFNRITAEYYGTHTPVNQLASFTMPEPRMIIVTPYDKSSMAAIEKAIRNSDLGVNPSNDG
ncbi:MAG: ribosome-recycling factor, partial [Streptosporangiaceae bacterium]